MHARLLLTNDDGINAAGLDALYRAVEPLAEVWVVAPEKNQTSMAHSVTIKSPVHIRKHDRPRWFSVDGTPADCAYLGVVHLMKDSRPTLLLSGINHGPNLGTDIVYSGTVAAAREGSLLGVPGIAISLATNRDFTFENAVTFVRQFVKTALAEGLGGQTVLNVNLPAPGPITEYEVTRLGRQTWEVSVREQQDENGQKHYWLGGADYTHPAEPGTDLTAVHDHNRASVTPLAVDLTSHTELDAIRAWRLEGCARKP